MTGMNQPGRVIEPEKNQAVTNYHNKKYKVFHKMYEDERSYKEIMNEDHNHT
jgi:hypothetical protein